MDAGGSVDHKFAGVVTKVKPADRLRRRCDTGWRARLRRRKWRYVVAVARARGLIAARRGT